MTAPPPSTTVSFPTTVRLCLSAFFVLCVVFLTSAGAAPRHGIAMHGEPKYDPDFTHFDYVNPDAPKGGTARLGAQGQVFDSLNPYTLKGVPAAGASLPFETLLIHSADEPFSEYGLVAETIETPEDRSWVIFTLRPQARWHDGTSITADDVVFSFDTLRTKGHPQYRFYYATVEKVEKLNPLSVKFSFKPGDNRELPLILGQLPLLPKHYWEGRDFESTTMDPPLGSGPYKIARFDPGRSIVYERVKDYWGENLAVRKGENNFDTVSYDYYRDTTVALEALKVGEFDFRMENEAKKWGTGYEDWSALKDGKAKKVGFPNSRPTGMQGYVFNIRRPLFADPRVRLALTQAFDFEWANKNLFYGQYTRTESYFSNSDLASRGLPGEGELALLTPFKGKIPDAVFSQEYHPPKTDGSGNIRPQLRTAMALLEEAGWKVENGRLTKDGQPFSFEILLDNPTWERISLPFTRNLERLGITASVRTVDTAQYKNRMDNFDFDMIVDVWGQSSSPGNEQRGFWGSQAAMEPGSQNSIGIQDPVIDSLIGEVIAAPDRESLVTRTRALDRVLLWQHYIIPHWHITYDRVVYWDKFGIPAITPQAGVQFFTWWRK